MGLPESISVVIPVYDEQDSLEPLVEELVPVLRGLGRRWEVVFVDDGSRDRSREVLSRIVAVTPGCRLVALRRNFGKGAALMAGFRCATGDIVVTMDADLQDDPTEIPALIRTLEDGADLVSGWKAERRDPLSKRIPSRIFNGVTTRISGLELHDLNCGLKAYRSEVVRSLALSGDLYRYIPVMAAAEGFRVRELAVNHRPRRFGRSKYGWERYVRGFLDLLTIMFIGRFRWRPMHLFGGVGLLFGLVGTVISAYLAIVKLAGGSIGQRPLLILGVLLIVVGVQMFTVGLLSEMIQRNHLRRDVDEVEARIVRVVDGPDAADGGQETEVPAGTSKG
jgi:glycosyltransferase involved in cell wall biosynthesis